jgi:hypothetical protein
MHAVTPAILNESQNMPMNLTEKLYPDDRRVKPGVRTPPAKPAVRGLMNRFSDK